MLKEKQYIKGWLRKDKNELDKDIQEFLNDEWRKFFEKEGITTNGNINTNITTQANNVRTRRT